MRDELFSVEGYVFLVLSLGEPKSLEGKRMVGLEGDVNISHATCSFPLE